MSTQETALVKVEAKELAKPEAQSGKLSRIAAFTPTNLTEAIALSKLIAGSELAPKDFKGKPANCLIAMQMGAEVGLAPMQALQNIAVINGRPSLWGDAALGVVQVHPQYEWHKEWKDGSGDTRAAYFQIKRKGHEIYTVAFTVSDAKKAQLWGKAGPWQTAPDRMLQMRARGFGLRDKFADALRGLSIAEEVMDIAPDTSDVKRKREEGTLDIGATVADLTPSTEPNRGHGNEGMQRRQADEQKQSDPKPENFICSDCGKMNGHEENCKHFAKAAQDAKTSKPTDKVAVLVKAKKASGKCKLVLICTNFSDGGALDLYVWHESLVPKIDIIDQPTNCVFEVSTSPKGYKQVEHIVSIGTDVYVNDQPAEQGQMDETEEEPF